MKKRLTLFLIGVLLSVSINADALTIKFATLAPEGSPWYKILREMIEEWKIISNGKINVKIYAGGVAGDESDMVRKMRIGQLHAAGITLTGLSDIVSDVGIIEMPMFITGYDELDYVLEKISLRLEKRFEEKGFKVLFWSEGGWARFFSQKPIIYPNDLKKQTMFVWGERSPINDLWKKKGVRVLAIAPTDIYTMLQAKKINAFIATPMVALSFQWFSLANQMTDMKIAPLVGAFIIKKKTWEKVPPELRPELEKAARRTGKRLTTEIRKLEGESIGIMKSHGLVENHVPDEAIATWIKFAEDGYPILLHTPSLKKIFLEVKRYIDDFRRRK